MVSPVRLACCGLSWLLTDVGRPRPPGQCLPSYEVALSVLCHPDLLTGLEASEALITRPSLFLAAVLQKQQVQTSSWSGVWNSVLALGWSVPANAPSPSLCSLLPALCI